MTATDFKWLCLAALVLGVSIISAAFVTGSTFGQICGKSFERGSPEWYECIRKLKEQP